MSKQWKNDVKTDNKLLKKEKFDWKHRSAISITGLRDNNTNSQNEVIRDHRVMRIN